MRIPSGEMRSAIKIIPLKTWGLLHVLSHSCTAAMGLGGKIAVRCSSCCCQQLLVECSVEYHQFLQESFLYYFQIQLERKSNQADALHTVLRQKLTMHRPETDRLNVP